MGYNVIEGDSSEKDTRSTLALILTIGPFRVGRIKGTPRQGGVE